jgi:hypothetical protein
MQTEISQTEMPCSVQEKPLCDSCINQQNLMCRFDSGDTLHFFMIFLPLFITAISGMIFSGYGVFLWGWLAYALFFFFVWEARILCSHCPFWAEPSRVLHCHANYGVIKFFRHHPEPMTRSEQAQFIVGALILVAYPIFFLVLAKQYLLVVIAAASTISFGYLLYWNFCSRCINFSCPVNHVPGKNKNAYLLKNLILKRSWEKAGYRVSDCEIIRNSKSGDQK